MKKVSSRWPIWAALTVFVIIFIVGYLIYNS